MEGSRPVGQKGVQEHVWLKHWNRDDLVAFPEKVGHGHIHSEDVVHGKNTHRGLVIVHKFHFFRFHLEKSMTLSLGDLSPLVYNMENQKQAYLNHVSHQVSVSELDSLWNTSGARAVR